MDRIPIWVFLISSCLFIYTTNSVMEQEVKNSLINFLGKLSNTNGIIDSTVRWNLSSDPCISKWTGVFCDRKNRTVKTLILDGFNLSGTVDFGVLCNDQIIAKSFSVLSIVGNQITGMIQGEIASCRSLTHLQLSGNQFFGNLPDEMSSLNNLNTLEISNNRFSGNLPDLARISGLRTFLAQYNQLNGQIPKFDFSNMVRFNVSYNYFSGEIPDGGDLFDESSYVGNSDLCGNPLQKQCDKSKGVSKTQILMYSGYAILGLLFIGCIILKLCKKGKKKEKPEAVKKEAAIDDRHKKADSPTSSEYKSGVSRSEFSASAETSMVSSSSLVVLTSPVVNGLKFEDLLRAPAELLGRGKHSSLYKVNFENGMVLVVKRIKDWAISNNDFKQRMERLDQVKHPNILPAVAFYCSKQEKLLVYEYQHNGSLFRLLHGTQMGQAFDWGSRLGVAASIAEALAFMHQELRSDEIPHGNLKSSNILLNKNMEPIISEYGLILIDEEAQPSNVGDFSSIDVYGFGVILLELLTGKLVQNNGVELTKWVHSVVREEWTAEVFDKSLFSEDTSEERMVSLLQVAIKCVNPLAQARPGMDQVSVMINDIKEDEERSAASEG